VGWHQSKAVAGRAAVLLIAVSTPVSPASALFNVRDATLSSGISSAPVHRVVDRRSTAVKLDAPLRLRPKSNRRRSAGLGHLVDHGRGPRLADFMCGSRTRNRHNGIDYLLGGYPWRVMAGEEVEIVAAASGVIVGRVDGLPDRECDYTNGKPANKVVIRQEDGLFAVYLHMQNGSVTSKTIGATVRKGEYLGLVGSSGASAEPHLHFELQEVLNDPSTRVDPYAGRCNGTDISLWKHQHAPTDTEFIRLATHSVAPVSTAVCTAKDVPIDDDPRYSNLFAPGATVFAAAYVKDQRPDTPVTFEFVRPDGTSVSTETVAAPPEHESLHRSHVAREVDAPGLWTFRATVDGRSAEHTFQVGGTAPSPTNVRVNLDPLARSPVSGVPTRITAYAENLGANDAHGCWVAHDYPVTATVEVQRLLRRGRRLMPVGRANGNFSILAGGRETLRITIVGRVGFVAHGIEIPFRIKCLNADGSAIATGYNTMWLSFEVERTPDVNVVVASVVGPPIRRIATVRANNTGAAGTLHVRSYGNFLGPVPLICELDGSGACVGRHARQVTHSFAAGGEASFQVLLAATDVLPGAGARVIVDFTDEAGIIRGANSFVAR
jgi:murein DD-endopeptidase MepM/ murein hydrolase activator NlpD